MLPTSPHCAHPATKLLQVERDGNPLRRFGHVSPFIGKLGPLDSDALDQIGLLVRAALPELPEPTLVIGMTESSLLLAFFVARWQQKPVDLRFTSRRQRDGETKRSFREPHSHGPEHFLALDPGRTYEQVIIIEDELTTGATLRNLILEIADVSKNIFVATLHDLRPQHLRDELQVEMQNLGIQLEILSLESVMTRPANEIMPVRPVFNPFGRLEGDRCTALHRLSQTYDEVLPDAIYMVGECVDIALQFWLQLPPASRPELRQVTRSPWKTDNEAISSAFCFPGDGSGSRYFIYNFTPPKNRRALFIAEASNANIAEQFGQFLESHNVEFHGIEVSG